METLEFFGQHVLLNYLRNHADVNSRKRILEQLHSMGNVLDSLAVVLDRPKPGQIEILPPHVATITNTYEIRQRDSAVTLYRKSDFSAQVLTEITVHGKELIRQGKVGCVILAGGQGTRLGFDGPKGALKPGLPSGRSLFEVIINRARRMKQLVPASSLPIYIMTARHNDDSTKKFFTENKFFGYDPAEIIFFQQPSIPAFDLRTRDILLDSPDSLTQSPNGNGGFFHGLKYSGILDSMKVEMLHVIGVDNILVKIADPVFIGLCDMAHVTVGNKCITKVDPHEKLGVNVMARVNGQIRPRIVEYTEIPDNQAVAIDATSGALKFSSGNIVNHFFRVDFIHKLINNPKFNYHAAIKKVPYWDTLNRHKIVPEIPNAVKLEYFIFDAFEAADCMLILETDRKSEFSPIKNKEGPDSPATAVQDLLNLHAIWRNQWGHRNRTDTAVDEVSQTDTYQEGHSTC